LQSVKGKYSFVYSCSAIPCLMAAIEEKKEELVIQYLVA
jgi:hypothetical protein